MTRRKGAYRQPIATDSIYGVGHSGEGDANTGLVGCRRYGVLVLSGAGLASTF